MPSVVVISVTTEVAKGNVLWQGSGFVVDQSRKYVLTDCSPFLSSGPHLSVAFKVRDNPTWWNAIVVRPCTPVGAAILQVTTYIDGPFTNFPPPLQFAERIPNALPIGIDVYILGFVSIVPDVFRGRYEGGYKGFLRVSATPDLLEELYGDMSTMRGGAVINSDGKILGMIAASSGEKNHPDFPAGVARGTYYVRYLPPDLTRELLR
jgi:hypothetical protein